MTHHARCRRHELPAKHGSYALSSPSPLRDDRHAARPRCPVCSRLILHTSSQRDYLLSTPEHPIDARPRKQRFTCSHSFQSSWLTYHDIAHMRSLLAFGQVLLFAQAWGEDYIRECGSEMPVDFLIRTAKLQFKSARNIRQRGCN